MKKEEKVWVSELRQQGLSFKEISLKTKIPLNTVKSFCYRNPTCQDTVLCRQCGKEVHQTPRARRKIFCSDYCRLSWWNAHPEQIHRNTKTHICPQCGKPFESHVDKRKYCSRTCYAEARRKENVG